ncbi:MAG TPA: cysteine synthase family protein [Planctomycetota bacterium]|nr:cysteine synthase family protein [Planctomycetota bacterium]
MIHRDAASLIGNTPVVELSRITEGLRGAIYAKIEFLNPGASKKDRIALRMIDDAMVQGRLLRGQTVLEVTSGNTGTGLAIVCAVRGLKFVAVMSAGNSTERRRMIENLGARVEVVAQAPGSPAGQVSGADLDLVIRHAETLTRELGAFRCDQFRDEANVRAHEEGTAEEIWADLAGKINMFCDFVGSGGTFVGVARGLKKHDASIRCYAVEPWTAPILSGKPVTRANHKIQGGGYSLRPPLWEDRLLDGTLIVTDEEAIRWSRELARVEGIFGGFSSGANLAAAMRLLQASQTAGEPARVVFTVNDSGLKYLSTDLWS